MVSIILNAQITLGEGSTAVGNLPINTNYQYSYSQQIFTKQEINANAAGNITGLKFYLDPSADITNSSDWVIYLGHTSKTSFTSATDWIPVTGLTEVFSGTITNANNVVEIVFTTPFAYDNVQNLVIAVDENTQNYDDEANAFSVYNTLGTQSKSILYRTDGSNPDPSSPPGGSLQSYRSVVNIMGLTPSAIPVCPVVTYPVNDAVQVPLSPAITWNASSGATGYKISIGTTPGGTDIVNQQTVTTTSFTPSSPLSIATTYYLQVVSVGTGGESQGCTAIKFKTQLPPPSNDDCDNAVTLTVNPDLNCGTVTAGTTLSATDSGVDPDPCYGNPDDDVWYKFTATQATHLILLKDVQSAGTTDSTDMYLQVLSGSCGSMSSVKCSDPETATVNDLNPGEIYYVRVYSYGGAGSAQNFNICIGTFPPPPSNDDCDNAVTLTVNPDMNCGAVTAGTTLSATDSGLDPDPCYGNPDDDVWYKFTAIQSTHVVSLKNVQAAGTGTSTDTYFQVLSGSCGSMSSVLCSDPEMATVTGLNPGETYYVRVYSYYSGTGNAQNFNICIGTLPPPPSNDNCDNAVTLAVSPDMNCGAAIAGTTLSATDSGIDPDPCYGNPDDDVWYKFTATQSSHIVSLQNVQPAGTGTSSNINFQVLSGICGGLTNVLCSDDNTSIVGGLTVGTTYYVRVYSYGGPGSAQSFNICVSSMPSPPVNDDCSGALAATVFPYTYTQSDALGATNNNGFIESCSDDGMNDGTWFTFTGDGTVHDITVSMPSGSGFDPQIGVYSGTCDNLVCVNTIDDEAGGETETLSVPTVAGTVYYINVGHYSDDEDMLEEAFTITINKETLGTAEIAKAKNEIKIYPNPFTDILNISKVDQVKSVSILDVSGRLVKTVENPSSALHLGDLKQGMYLIMLNMKDSSKQTIKAIKK